MKAIQTLVRLIDTAYREDVPEEEIGLWDYGCVMAKTLGDEVAVIWTSKLLVFFFYRSQVRQLYRLQRVMMQSRAQEDIIAVLTHIADNTTKWQGVFNSARKTAMALIEVAGKRPLQQRPPAG
jgi:hypothetical protein